MAVQPSAQTAVPVTTTRHRSPMHQTTWFDYFNVGVMVVVCLTMLYPIWYSLVISFNEGMDAMLGGIYWWPRKFSLENYRAVFQNPRIINGFVISVLRTVIGTTVAVFFTAMVAYAYSKRFLIWRGFFLTLGILTLFFQGGLIPTYLVYFNLGLVNRFAVYILPTMFEFFHAIIFMTFFRGIPESLEESAKMDGANDMHVFWRIVIPLSTPVVATIAVFQGVWNWNDFFYGVIYITNDRLQPIQTYLYKVIAQTSSYDMMPTSAAGMAASMRNQQLNSESIKMATMMVTTVPIVIIYPLLQRHFVKGVMVGSIKG